MNICIYITYISNKNGFNNIFISIYKCYLYINNSFANKRYKLTNLNILFDINGNDR